MAQLWARVAVLFLCVPFVACSSPPQAMPPHPTAEAATMILAYPNDVKVDATVSMDAALASKPPSSLRFVVRPTTFVRFHQLIVTGELINDANTDVEAIVFPAGPFVVMPDPSMRAKPKPPGIAVSPPVPPPPLGIVVPGRATVTFEAALDLTAFDYVVGAHAQLPWTFTFWNDPKPAGTIAVVLPPP